MGRSKQSIEGTRQCHWEERIRRQPEGNEFEAATPLICLVLSATDKLGQIGEEKEKRDEKGNKEHFYLCGMGFSQQEARTGKTLSISEAPPISTLAAGCLRLFQRTQSTF